MQFLQIFDTYCRQNSHHISVYIDGALSDNALWDSLVEGDHFGDLDIDVRIMLKRA